MRVMRFGAAGAVSPIVEAEMTHQQRAGARLRWRRLTGMFVLALLALSFPAVLSIYLIDILAAALATPTTIVLAWISGYLSTLAMMLVAALIAQNLVLIGAALHLASGAVAREKRGGTWESLLLTGIDARQIVIGKWWATLRVIWDGFAGALLVRAGAVLWLSATQFFVRYDLRDTDVMAGLPPLPVVIFSAVMVCACPLLCTGLAAALGLLASMFTRTEAAAMRAAFGLLALTFALLIGLFALAVFLSLSDVLPAWTSSLMAFFLAPLDGGMLTIFSELTVYTRDMRTGASLINAVVCLLPYIPATGLILSAAQRLAVRQSALPPTDSVDYTFMVW